MLKSALGERVERAEQLDHSRMVSVQRPAERDAVEPRFCRIDLRASIDEQLRHVHRISTRCGMQRAEVRCIPHVG